MGFISLRPFIVKSFFKEILDIHRRVLFLQGSQVIQINLGCIQGDEDLIYLVGIVVAFVADIEARKIEAGRSAISCRSSLKPLPKVASHTWRASSRRSKVRK
jgi:hypothetical protein